jgi:uncharacterized protein (TIRG00374 family)
MSSRLRKSLTIAVSAGISVLALAWCFQQVKWPALLAEIREVSWWVPWTACLLYLLGFVPRALRCRMMLSHMQPIKTILCWQVVVLGYAANNLLPLRLGELVRAYVMGRRAGVSKLSCLSLVGAERILDGLIIVGILGLSIVLLAARGLTVSDALVQQVFVFGGVLFTAASGVLLALSLFARRLNLSHYFLPRRSHALLRSVLEALDFLHTFRTAVGVLSLSVLVWFVEGFMFVLLLHALGIPHPWQVGYFSLALINLGILVPSAPGYIGVFQAFGIIAFSSLGLSESKGLAFSMILHLCQFLPVTVLGIGIFLLMGFHWSDVESVQKQRP